ncbi:MAG: chain-length determining protein [Bacteroidaceae bacterium]|nr:chain-length determining protein [Bacteroidaceae bacterium]
MSMDNQQQYNEPQEQEEDSHIDYKAILAALKKRKSLYKKVLPITFVVACIIMLSIPNYYTCEVQLAPELSTSRSSSSISALASQFGLKMGSGVMGNSEALYPTLYPDLVNSTDFKVSLFNIPVHKKDSTRVTSYYDYLMNDQKEPWWSSAIGAAVEGLVSLLPLEEDTIDEHHVDPFQLTKLQTMIVKSLEKKVVCDVDNKTLVITISVTDQDPLICATMADSVKARLQDFITEYRTKKARVDLEYNQKLYEEAKVRYDEAREKYATYADANQELMYQTDRTRLINLENDMQLKYNAYNSMAQQLIASEAKVQEETPSFTTLQSATVPVKKVGPARSKIVLIILFLAFLCTSAWILHKEGQLKPLLGLS